MPLTHILAQYLRHLYVASYSQGETSRPYLGVIAALLQLLFTLAGWEGYKPTILAILAAFFSPRLYYLICVGRIYFFNPKLPARADKKSPGFSKESYQIVSKETLENFDDYQHFPLLLPGCFRLLKFKNSTSDIVECSLEIVHQCTAPPFNALSYHWGPPDSRKYIFCDGKKLAVMENCEAALRRLRNSFSGRHLWVDAICIDQRNMTEKNHQLRMMGYIYSAAKEVIVWLGPGTPESDVAWRYMLLSAVIGLFLPKAISERLEDRLWNKIVRK